MIISEFDLICLHIAKSGFWGGDPEKISKATPNWIIKTLDYMGFCDDYKEQLRELNTNKD